VGIHVMTGFDPGYPQRGPAEASEGIYPGRGQGKTGGGTSLMEPPEIAGESFLKIPAVQNQTE
jgi:hypothetical protein